MSTPLAVRPSSLAGSARARKISPLIGLALASVAAACGAEDVPPADAGMPDAPSCTPSAETPKLDLLFVIENSTIDTDQLRVLFDGMSDFSVLANQEGVVPDLHIGVISANLGGGACGSEGDGGRLQSRPRSPGCMGPEGPFIRYEIASDGTRLTNFSMSLADTFRCIGFLGGGGCGFDQPLESLKRALDGSVPENEGFRREDACLAIVFWLEEDDCSASDPNLFNRDDPSYGPLGLRCVLHDIVCGDPPEALTTMLGVYEPCVPASEPRYLHPVSRYVDFLKSVEPDPARLALAGWVFPRNPLRIIEDSSGNLQVGDPCAETGSFALGPSIRIQTLFDEILYTSTLSQCDRYPEPSVVGELVSSIRRMLYCE